MALVLLNLLRVLLLLVTEAALLDQSRSSNIRLGSSLNPDTNSSWFSPSGLFAFGFYKQDGGFAVGIWLRSKPDITVVWTANRDDPPVSSNSTVQLTRDGRLVLHTTYGEEKNITSGMVSATSASMHDSGNFVLYNDSLVIWESFSYPCDTILGGQNLTGLLVSSVSASQHSRGRFVLDMQSDGNLVAYPLNSSRWPDDSYWSSGTPSMKVYSLNLDFTGSLYLYFSNDMTPKVFHPPMNSRPGENETVIFRAILDPDGNFVLYSHRSTTMSNDLTLTKTEWAAFEDPCSAKGMCGVNSYCSIAAGNVECHCFPGFSFFNETRNGKFLGCYRNFIAEEGCDRKGLKLSYTITALDNMDLGVYSYFVMNLSKEACSISCLEDCNCWASLYKSGSCKKLKAPIIYARLAKSKSTVFIKVKGPHRQLAASRTLEKNVGGERKKLVSILAITLGSLALVCTMMSFSSFCFYKVHARRYQSLSENVDFGLIRDHFTLRSFSFEELEKATDGFKEVIGRNSFGEVYKGFIYEGKKAVAVKRLQRLFEGEGGFRAEITAIGQTHHRNLVSLLGFCIQGARKLLVYEFMSNGSLADLLLNAETRPGWKELTRVALDVARGILYLHEECETRIIHCNINPHNVLFDESWTAKISDFGLSKLLRPNQSGTLTGIRGTRGYLAPEWHKNTLISTKVDIFSFGVVLLEIMCCRSDMEIDISTADKRPLSTWVYDCFVAKELNKLIGDEEVDYSTLERMVKVGLLCIQDDPDARPAIKNVILMLEGTIDVPVPPSPTLPLLI